MTNTRFLTGMESSPLGERIRELCAKAITAEDSEVQAVLSELQAALREHSQVVRQMATQTLNGESEQGPSDHKIAL